MPGNEEKKDDKPASIMHPEIKETILNNVKMTHRDPAETKIVDGNWVRPTLNVFFQSLNMIYLTLHLFFLI